MIWWHGILVILSIPVAFGLMVVFIVLADRIKS